MRFWVQDALGHWVLGGVGLVLLEVDAFGFAGLRSGVVDVCIYMHACMHAYIHTRISWVTLPICIACIPTYIRTYVHEYIRTDIQTYVPAYERTYST